MSYNKIIQMGRLTRDPDLRQIPSGTSVCEFGLATDTGWGDNKKPCFIDCVVWGKQAESLAQFFKKGDGIVVDGELVFEQWEKDGKKNSKHKISVQKWSFPVGVPVSPEKKKVPKSTESDWVSKEDIDTDSIPF